LADIANQKFDRADIGPIKCVTWVVIFLVPHITACSTISCILGKQLPPEFKHKEQLVILVLWKFINPMLNSYAATATDLQTKAPTVSKNKLSNRKYNTLSK
jgi:hypothetical protein